MGLFPRGGKYAKSVGESWNSLLSTGTSSGAQVLRTIAGIPSGPLVLVASSWRRVLRTFRVDKSMGDIANLKGGRMWLDPLVVQVGV